MKKLLLAQLILSCFYLSAQTGVEPFAPAVPGTYIGDMTPFVVGADLPAVSNYTEEGNIGGANNDWTVDDGTVIADFSVGAVGKWVAGRVDYGDEYYLVTPEMDFGQIIVNPTLNFRYRIDNGAEVSAPGYFSSINLEVLYKESAGGQWNSLSTQTLVDNVWHDVTVDLSGASSYQTYYLGFRIYCVTPGSFITWGYMGLDEIVVNSNNCSASSSSYAVTSCQSYTVPSGDETYTTSGIVMDTIPNANGCDSVMTIDLTITNLDIGTTTNDYTITSTATGVSYQWINCATLSAIPGQTGSSFTATANGSYAVIVVTDDGGCADTSECVTIAGIGLDELTDNMVKMFPNPTQGKLFVEFQNQAKFTDIVVYSLDGTQLMHEIIGNSEQIELSMASLCSGTYIICLRDANGLTVNELIQKL